MTGTKKWWKKHKRIVYTLGILTVLMIGLLVFYVLRDMPNPMKMKLNEYSESSEIFDRNGKLLYLFYSDKRRISVSLDQIPDNLKKATIAVEDKNFYTNNGFDFGGILRGFIRSVFQGRLQGGSTLTQQLVKNALLTPERTISRKIKEAILTVAMNLTYPSQIAAIESRGDATTIHLTGGSIINVPRPLDDFAESLGLAS